MEMFTNLEIVDQTILKKVLVALFCVSLFWKIIRYVCGQSNTLPFSYSKLNTSGSAQSSTIKVHGSPISTATMRVTATLYEKQLGFELVPINLRSGDNKKEPFLSRNPFGQIPAFEDGDLKLFESRAITQYIAQEYADKGTELVTSDSKKMAVTAVWKEVEGHHFDPIASKLVWELRVKPTFGMVVDPAVVYENEAKLGVVLDVYEKRLSESKYLGGDCFTLADLHHLPCIHYLMNSQSKKLFESRPHVNAWVADITARPAWSKVIAMIPKQ